MVAGADTMLDCISGSMDICKIQITTEPTKDFAGDGVIKKTSETELSRNKANAENLWKRSVELVKLQEDETLFAL
jgi:hypothetical protein